MGIRPSVEKHGQRRPLVDGVGDGLAKRALRDGSAAQLFDYFGRVDLITGRDKAFRLASKFVRADFVFARFGLDGVQLREERRSGTAARMSFASKAATNFRRQ
jgi:hypothetical protein